MRAEGVTPATLPPGYNADARRYLSRYDAAARGVVILHFYGTGPKVMLDFL